MLRMRYEESYDFPDQKGFDAYIGEHEEGEVVWFGPEHELVTGGYITGGWYYSGYVPHQDVNSGDDTVYDTFEECAKAFERAILGANAE